MQARIKMELFSMTNLKLLCAICLILYLGAKVNSVWGYI
ncbi:hypothetical protein PflQ2_0677 [Pseudomonas fluorescens Q2-87]|uniref:Uncharacterized protein n=1 Tax=Pseudomonas fluorescens (strain Q2-87) TaxID=1038922 RepID=J2YF90_PSEFQ|nr:hypothetical protein PflQ2_0677 [Pseudomonas fluorescens Q2-87]